MATNKEKYNRKYGFAKDKSHSIASISKNTGVSVSILNQVRNRGVGAWKNNIASVRLKSGKKDFSVMDRSKKMTKEQWSIARVYSFVMGGKTQKTADKDLWQKHLKSKKKK